MRIKITIFIAGIIASALLSFVLSVDVFAAQISRVVTTNADSGPGSLRQAIIDANAKNRRFLLTF